MKKDIKKGITIGQQDFTFGEEFEEFQIEHDIEIIEVKICEETVKEYGKASEPYYTKRYFTRVLFKFKDGKKFNRTSTEEDDFLEKH